MCWILYFHSAARLLSFINLSPVETALILAKSSLLKKGIKNA